MDDLMTSQSIGGHIILNVEIIDPKIASALKRNITSQHFRRRNNVEEQHLQKQIRFVRGRLIAYMIYEHFRAFGAHEAALDLSSRPFTVSLQGDEFKISIQNGTKLS